MLVRHYYRSEHAQMQVRLVSVTLLLEEHLKPMRLNLETLKEKEPRHLLLAVGPLGASAPKRAP